MTALTEIEGKQLAFASEAASAAEARYRETQVLLKRLGLKPSRFVRQSKLAMGGPYEPVGEDSDPAFRKLFSSWSKRSEEHKSELQSLMRISYAVICLKKKKVK